ncbi:hypothetical protein E2C01_002214 [Portunus trituberculatus]|uniref:Uncharacterized protein n=1 Tax=Portunus trituberculatus TaxID=210409 RepID=A0A5B7CJC2_PORTR|nr:hypothetical protein [Portunus trituberculatus]
MPQSKSLWEPMSGSTHSGVWGLVSALPTHTQPPTTPAFLESESLTYKSFHLAQFVSVSLPCTQRAGAQ